MKSIRFTGFTLLLLALMVAGTPVQAGGFHRLSRDEVASPFTRLLAAAADLWHRLVTVDDGERRGIADGADERADEGAIAKADPTPPSGSSTTTGGGITPPPGGGCIDPNGCPK